MGSRRLVRAFVVAVVLGVVGLVVVGGAGCEDPCVTLANRICNCEQSSSERINCRSDRITTQQSSIKIEDADRVVCEEKLKTCTCDALDVNEFDKCGFVPEGGQ